MAKKKDKEEPVTSPETEEPVAAEPPDDAAAPETAADAETAKEPEPETAKEPTAEEQLKAERDKYLRLCAEFDNYRKRSQREREGLYESVKSDLVLKFLPVYDNLERALAQETQDEPFRKGIEMTMTQLTDVLNKMGVTVIKAVGEKFDAKLHDAVMHVEDDEHGEGEIIEEFRKGFKLGDKVIRFSMVKVAN